MPSLFIVADAARNNLNNTELRECHRTNNRARKTSRRAGRRDEPRAGVDDIVAAPRPSSAILTIRPLFGFELGVCVERSAQHRRHLNNEVVLPVEHAEVHG